MNTDVKVAAGALRELFITIGAGAQKDESMCVVAGCTNPKRRYVYGRNNFVEVARCDKHCDELNRRNQQRYQAKQAAKGLKARSFRNQWNCRNINCNGVRAGHMWETGYCSKCSP